MLLSIPAARLPDSLSDAVVMDHRVQSSGKGGTAPCLVKPSRLVGNEQFGVGTDIGQNRWNPCEHGFDNRDAESFVESRIYIQVHSRQQRSDLVAVAREDHRSREPSLANVGLKGRSFRPVTDEEKAKVRGGSVDSGEGPHQGPLIPYRQHPADVSDKKVIVRESQLRAHIHSGE